SSLHDIRELPSAHRVPVAGGLNEAVHGRRVALGAAVLDLPGGAPPHRGDLAVADAGEPGLLFGPVALAQHGAQAVVGDRQLGEDLELFHAEGHDASWQLLTGHFLNSDRYERLTAPKPPSPRLRRAERLLGQRQRAGARARARGRAGGSRACDADAALETTPASSSRTRPRARVCLRCAPPSAAARGSRAHVPPTTPTSGQRPSTTAR